MDGPPQRPLRRFRVPALVLSVVCLVALVGTVAAQTGFLTNGNFEAGTSGWMTAGDLVISADTSVGGTDGPSALQVVAGAAGVYQVRSEYWLSPSVTPGAAYGLEAWIRDNDPGVRVALGLDFLDGSGTLLTQELSVPTSLDSPDFQRLMVQRIAPPGSVYARVAFEGTFDDAGATFAVDGVVLAQVGAAPTEEPTQQPPPPPPPAPATATPKVSPTPRPTATPKPVRLPIGPFLRIAEGGDLVAPWEVTRGRLELAPGAAGLLLSADGGSTVWVEQAVTVIPGAWYQATARLVPLEGVRSAWVRIAWYASADASGSQMETDDSEVVTGDGVRAIVVAGGLVGTGAVQAPDEARSAKVRILLQPEGAAGAAVIIDGVAFDPAEPPEATPSPTPTTTPAPTAAPTGTPSGTPAAAADASPAPAVLSPTVSPAVLSAQGAFRITEVMPDPPQSGRDADYEWVELTNLGEVEATLQGMALRDAHASTALPPTVVPSGASIVVAGRLAEVDADVRLDGPIGNGLGNDGDRIELVDAAGRVVDAFDYGEGTDLSPRPGESIQRWFDGSSQLAGADVGTPSPGVHAPLVSVVEAPSNIASGVAPVDDADTDQGTDAVVTREDDADLSAWVLLLAVGGGAFGGMVVQRIGQRRASPPAP